MNIRNYVRGSRERKITEEIRQEINLRTKKNDRRSAGSCHQVNVEVARAKEEKMQN